MNAPRHAPRSPLTTSLSLRAQLTLRWTLAFGLVLTLALLLVFIGARTFGYAALDLHLRTVAATELASSTDQGAPIHLHEFPVGALNDREFAPKFSLIYAADGTLVAHTGGFRPGDMEFDHGFPPGRARRADPADRHRVAGTARPTDRPACRRRVRRSRTSWRSACSPIASTRT